MGRRATNKRVASKPATSNQLIRDRLSSLLVASCIITPLLILISLAYGKLIHGYFAADEWWGFSFAIASGNLKEALKPSGVYAPGANLFIYSLYHLFGTRAIVWAILTLVIHTANTGLVFWLASRLSKNRWLALWTAGLFAFLPMGSQFIHQFSLMPTSGVASLLALSSLVAYSYRKLILALILLLLSFSFSPYTVPFIFFTGLLEISLFSKKEWWRSVGRLVGVGGTFGLYYYLLNRISLKAGGLYDRPIHQGEDVVERLKAVGEKIYNGYGELLAQKPGLIDPAVMQGYSHYIVATAVVLIIILFLTKRYQYAKTALIGLLWIPASLALFSTLSTVAINVTYPSRYFYLSTVGLGLLVGSLVVGLLDYSINYAGQKIHIGSVMIGCLLLAAVGHYLPKTQAIITAEINTGKAKRLVIDAVTKAVPPPLQQRDGLFCFTSDTGHYATGPETIPLPFPINFNFPLAVIYRAKEPGLKSLFGRSDYFVNPAASWYWYAHPEAKPWEAGPGIGFATNLNDCQKMLGLYPFINHDQVYGFAYLGEKRQVIDISKPLRQYLAGDQTVRDQLYPK